MKEEKQVLCDSLRYTLEAIERVQKRKHWLTRHDLKILLVHARALTVKLESLSK